jgi:AcrR family transcriptional regulator
VLSLLDVNLTLFPRRQRTDKPAQLDDANRTSIQNPALNDAGGSSVAPVRSAKRSESRETQTKILDAAEALFIETGFSATSFRAIAKHAGVNLSAAHYHFGSKEGLFGAALHRRVAPLTRSREANLNRLEASAATPTVNEVIRGYLGPLCDVAPDSPLPSLIARLYGEPDSIQQPLVIQEFSATAERFLSLLRKALPEVPTDVVQWRFHFVIGSMIFLLSHERPPILFGPDEAAVGGLDQLIEFATTSLSAPVFENTAASTSSDSEAS